MNVFNKEEFINAIEEIQKSWDFTNKLNNLLDDYPDCGYLFPPDAIDVTIRALVRMFDDNYDIEFFCYELNFGRGWKPGEVTDKDGNDVCLATAADLYDAIMKFKKGRENE